MTRTERYLIWLLAGAPASAAVAWMAFQIQQDGIAPAVLFPILVGAALGTALAVIGHLVRLPFPRTAIAAAVCWGLLAALAQDYIGHRYRLRLYDTELNQQNPLAAAVAREGQWRPTLADHLAGKWRTQPVWWTLDLLLTAAAAGLVTAAGMGRNTALQSRSPGAREPGDA